MKHFRIESLALLLINLGIFCSQTSLSAIGGELYASMEELRTNWALTKNQIVNLLENQIQFEEIKLNKLQTLHELFLKTLHYDFSNDEGITSQSSDAERMMHPIGAFVTFNRLIKVLDNIESFYGESEPILMGGEQLADTHSQEYIWKSKFDLLKEKHNLPSRDDLVGCGEALLRLQAFYNLNIDHMIKGKLLYNSKLNANNGNASELYNYKIGPKLNSDDCYELGKIAYDSGSYPIAIQWFYKALVLIAHEEDKIFQDAYYSTLGTNIEVRINELLEYMAFAAYKNGQLKYSAQLTKIWLERDPENERARGNLEYYEEELGGYHIDDLQQGAGDNAIFIPNSSIGASISVQLPVIDAGQYTTYLPREEFSPANYVISEDKVVQDLCKPFVPNVNNRNETCFKKLIPTIIHHTSPEINIEILHKSPYIIRLYDVVTDYEASHLRQLALPRLQRATVQSKSGLVTTDFRIAKTAWLSAESDPVVNRVEKRLSAILNLDLHNSEDLQVVNYGLGGFYGPHLDSARESSSSNYNSSISINYLKSNDRMATILLYLNQVEAGGSTVFPRLGLSAEPIKGSALVWFNILKNGLGDERTLHTGCPVLLGSKWIATKWPREEANSFLRPCSLKRED